ncbi:MAG: hypothetical protein IKE23_03005 [Exiguobacterium sp.]|nr:hypothetical protein [Exiguobacterium sp.]
MSSESKSNGAAGIGFFGLLQIAFIILKLCGVITWSWWAVLIPCWVELGICIIALFALWIYWMWVKRQ